MLVSAESTIADPVFRAICHLVAAVFIANHLLQNGDGRIADSIGSSRGGQSGGGHQADQQHQSQKETYKSLLHSNLLLFSYVSSCIITDPVTNCNTFFQKNYIFVTINFFCKILWFRIDFSPEEW